jgi:O-antigen ligase
MLGLGVAIVAIGSGAALASPFAGLLLYWLWVVVRPQEVWPSLGGGLPLERIMALTLLASLLLRGKLRSLPEMDRGRATIALLVFLGVNCVSALTALDRGFAAWVVIDFARTVVFFVCIVALIEDDAQLRKGLWTYSLAIGWVAGSSLWNYAAHPYYRQGIQRATGLAETGGDPNAIASTLTLAIPVLLVLLKGARGIRRIFLAGILAAIVVCIILTGSRMGFIMLLLVLLLTAARSAKAKLLVPVMLAFLGIGWLALPAEYQGRYQTIASFAENPLEEGSTSAQESAHGRIIGFEVAWQMFLDRPLLGVGAGSFPLAWKRPDTPYNYNGYKGWHQPHNLPGQILSELGLVGLLSFGWYLIAVRGELREARAHIVGTGAADERGTLFIGLAGALGTQLVLLLFGGFSGHNLYRTDWYVVGALAIVTCRLAAQTVRTGHRIQAAQPAPAPGNPALITASSFAEGRNFSDQAW